MQKLYETKYSKEVHVKFVNGNHIPSNFLKVVFQKLYCSVLYYFFSYLGFFHEHLRFTGEQGKGEALSFSL